jgi:hypothetical protein
MMKIKRDGNLKSFLAAAAAALVLDKKAAQRVRSRPERRRLERDRGHAAVAVGAARHGEPR